MISAAATALAGGPLARAGGAVVVEVPGGVDELRRDVGRGARDASRVRKAVPHDVRKGDPDRSLLSITGGPGLEALYRGWALADLVTSVTGTPCVPLGSTASYSGYGPGDHLGVHRDIPGCDVTVIVVVDDTGDERGRPHPLWTWAERATEDLATIRATPRRGRQPVRATHRRGHRRHRQRRPPPAPRPCPPASAGSSPPSASPRDGRRWCPGPQPHPAAPPTTDRVLVRSPLPISSTPG